MKKIFGLISCLVAFLLVTSCHNNSPYPEGFEEQENGAVMEFFVKGDSDVVPSINDEVTFHVAEYLEDSLLFTTAGKEPVTMIVCESDFVGDVHHALQNMHVGDSACVMVVVDSLFLKSYGELEVPEDMAGKSYYYHMKLLSVKPYEVLMKEHQILIDSLKQVEMDLLATTMSNPKYTVTESGLIVMEKSGKGRVAQMGEYVEFDFTLCHIEGDTIVSTFGVEPVLIQYGEDFMGEGFNEALGMLPVGGKMRCVIPSKLAFDSIGFNPYILPYSPILVTLKMNSIMDQKAFEKKQADMEAEMKAEMDRQFAANRKDIAEYVKSQGLVVSPTQSGLYIIDREEGTGSKAKKGDVVSVHCVMKSLDDLMIASSYEYGEPMTFTIGSGEMIPAIEETVLTMAPGAKTMVIAPSDMAFRDYDFGGSLPPFTPLIIELELLEIK